ncbi:hypothetical protein NIES4072_20830 [Nostoc commune NIES-4072]|uniref:Uncharacterized protein n=1 Tax=Nostoc commune NIES-4072 TaxID=2005467 RepID=A0A2R5FLT3_NOSCO|nr:hypothetical protein [Nostoc commune]BBD64255.1 hypothetical protein NIES4070_05970 [Nostoc commune HK-02]GBG18418.1 hypothetical protein NIES4072_20830 [Nostoc commune NIES-4072]
MVLSFKSVKKLSVAVIGSALAAAFIGLEAKSANAALFIDQEQSSSNVNMAYFSQSDLAQSFKPTANNVAGAAIKLTKGIGTVGDVKISLLNCWRRGFRNWYSTRTVSRCVDRSILEPRSCYTQ